MGGYGSGQTQQYASIEGWLNLPMQRIKQLGYLVDGHRVTSTINWTARYGGRVTATSSIGLTVSIGQHSGRGTATVNYTAAGNQIIESIPLVYKHRTWYFVCLGCGHKRRVLYSDGGKCARFRCRVCYHLIYTSSRESSAGKSAINNLIRRGMLDDVSLVGCSDLIHAMQIMDRELAKLRAYDERHQLPRRRNIYDEHHAVAQRRAKRAATRRWRNYRRRERYHQRKNGLMF